MPMGGGTYDDLATYVREKANATAVIVVVLGGKDGNGFEVQSRNPLTTTALPALLRDLAAAIEGDADVAAEGWWRALTPVGSA